MHNSATGEPRYISDGYELEGFELPVGCVIAIVVEIFGMGLRQNAFVSTELIFVEIDVCIML